MPCKEMLELEASFSHYAERRRMNVATPDDRRQDSNEGFRVGEARFAYIVLQHRLHCKVCRG